jgi:hypothetical protein
MAADQLERAGYRAIGIEPVVGARGRGMAGGEEADQAAEQRADSAFAAAASLPGRGRLDAWRFASAVTAAG